MSEPTERNSRLITTFFHCGHPDCYAVSKIFWSFHKTGASHDWNGTFTRLELEDKGKVVASVWGTESLPRKMFCLGQFEKKDEFDLSFQIDQGKTANATRNWTNSAHQTWTRRPLPCLLIPSFFYAVLKPCRHIPLHLLQPLQAWFLCRYTEIFCTEYAVNEKSFYSHT